MKKTLALITSVAIMALGARAQVILQDSFSYSDGVTTVVSGGLWVRHSGTANDSFVNAQKLEVYGTRADDINRPFTNTASSVLYASFLVCSTNLVAGSNYFAHFYANGTTFRGKIFSNPGSSPNTWRVGVSANSSSPKVFPLDLATNVYYRVVYSYDTVNFLGTLWVDPVVSTDPSVATSDSTTAATLVGYGFRQSSGCINARIDDLYVGNSFADVAVGAPVPATVYYSPNPVVNAFVGNNTNLYCVARGSGAVSFQWQKNGVDLTDDANTVGSTSNVLSLVNVLATQSGTYRCKVTSVTNSVTQNVVFSGNSSVTFSAAPVPPTINTQPASQFAYRGQNVTFSVGVTSPGNLTYQWYSNNIVLPTETAATLTISSVTTNISGSTYKVAVTNDVVTQGVVSSSATLTVSNPPRVSIAFLRKLVDPTTYQATNFTQPYEVAGVVTTYTNITTGNTASYYLQDGTAGVNIFVTGDSSFRPQQGDVLTFTGVTSSFTSGFELVANTALPYTSYNNIISNNFPLPAPIAIPFTVTNNNYSNVNYTIAGSLVKLSGVFFGELAGTTISNTVNQTIVVSNYLGQTFSMNFFFLDQDTAGKTLPNYASSVTGVLYGNMPNFSLAVTRFSDIVTNVLDSRSASGSLILNWTAPSSLQSATNIAGPWTDLGITGGAWVTNTTGYPQEFYRVQMP